MAESALVSTTSLMRQKAGRSPKGFAEPRACALEPAPPPRAGDEGGRNAPAATVSTSAIRVFGSASDVRLSQVAARAGPVQSIRTAATKITRFIADNGIICAYSKYGFRGRKYEIQSAPGCDGRGRPRLDVLHGRGSTGTRPAGDVAGWSRQGNGPGDMHEVSRAEHDHRLMGQRQGRMGSAVRHDGRGAEG